MTTFLWGISFVLWTSIAIAVFVGLITDLTWITTDQWQTLAIFALIIEGRANRLETKEGRWIA